MNGPRRLLPEVARLLPSVLLASIILIASGIRTEARATSLDAPLSFEETLAPNEEVDCLAVSDLDGDGVPELIGSEPSAERIVIWALDGEGGVRLWKTHSCPIPGKFVTADFNGDGAEDLAVISRPYACARCEPRPRELRILAGLGHGEFRDLDVLELSSRPQSLASGDLNGDARPDLVFAADDSVFVMLNTGDGFRPPVAYEMPAGIAGVAMGDVDRDGFGDIVVASYGETRVYPGNDAGTLGTPAILPFGSWDSTTPVLADFDRDGGLDLVLPRHGGYSGGFEVFWNTGTGLSDAPEQVPGISSFTDCIIAADLDGDERKDLVAVPSYGMSDRILIEWNMGSRTWEHSILVLGEESGHYSPAIAAYDFDLDGFLDIVDTHNNDFGYGGELRGFRHISARGLAALQEYPLPEPVVAAWVTTLPDGRAAILVQNADSTRVMAARPDGSFEPAVVYPEAAGAYGIDWNGDGCADLAIPRGDSTEIRISGGGREVAPILPPEPLLGRGDFNGDGLEDVLLSGVGLLVAFRDSLHGFLTPTPLPDGSDHPQLPGPIATGDFNGDGLCDLAAGSQGLADSLTVYLNLGGGLLRRSFAVAVAPMPPGWGMPTPTQVLSCDVDGDHKLDIVYAALFQYSDLDVWVGRGVGDGVFDWTPDRYGIPSEAAICTVVDVTNHGLPDLIGMSRWTGVGLGRFSFRANLGDARFEQDDFRHEVGHYPEQLSVGDLNHDGRMDVVIASNGYPSEAKNYGVRVLLNTGRDLATPLALSPLRAVLQGLQARIEWYSQDRTSISGTVMRSDDGGPWHPAGTAASDGSGLVAFTDVTVRAGSRYSYRLDYVAGGVARHTASIELYVPATALSLALAHGNPAHGRLQMSCVLPSTEPARLELFDIAGRRVDSKVLARSPAGDAASELNSGARLAAGVYWARLTQGARAVGTRIVLLP